MVKKAKATDKPNLLSEMMPITAEPDITSKEAGEALNDLKKKKGNTSSENEESFVEKTIKQYEKYAKNQIKVQDPNKKGQNSTILKAELKNCGVEDPPYDFASHHIAGATESRAKEARDILAEVGIDINSAANGVNLPRASARGDSSITTESMHTGRHKGDATEESNKIIVQAKIERLLSTGRKITDKLDKNDPEDVKAITDALHEVRIKLLKGEIKMND